MMIKAERPSFDDLVSVYWNYTRKCFSIRNQRTHRVCDYTDSIMIDRPEFIVNEAGRQRVLRTKEKNVHAWVSGRVLGYKSLITESGLTPLDIFSCREMTVRNVTYNPYKYNMFVQMAKPFAPVLLADMVCLSTWGNGGKRHPKIAAYRADMWGEFTEAVKPCYEVMCEAWWAEIKIGAPSQEGYDELERAGIIWSQIHNDTLSYFWSEQTVSTLDKHVVRFGPSHMTWGFFDETDFYHHGFVSEAHSYSAMIKHKEGQ